MGRIGWLLAVLAPMALPADNIEAFGHKWTVPVGAEWKIEKESGGEVLKLLAARPQETPRRPIQFALAETPAYQRVTIEADVKRVDGKSLIIVYAFHDATHFNYAHLSSDDAMTEPVHNGIFHVFGGERVRISPLRGPGTLATDGWHRVKLTHDARSGIVSVTVDGKSSPSLEAVDLSLGAGRVGLGSFFEKAHFRNVKITGVSEASQQ